MSRDAAGDEQQLLEALGSLGVPEGEAKAAIAEDGVPLVLARRIAGEGRDLSLDDVADQAGVPTEMLTLWQSALGLAPRDAYGARDVEHAGLLRRLLEVIPVGGAIEPMLHSIRADGQALRRMALADLQMVHDLYVKPVRQGGGTDIDVAVALARAARDLLPLASPLVGAGYRRVLEDLLSTELVEAATARETEEVDLAVAFVDVVGFTSLSARVDPTGLEEVLSAFEARCYAVVSGSERVELVKFLGDAAMLVSLDPAELARVLLQLVGPVEDDDSALAGAPSRGGLAAGPMLPRVGDYFGPPVNLAARLTDRARPWTVLADEDLADVLNVAFELRKVPPMNLHGIGRRRPVAVRPA